MVNQIEKFDVAIIGGGIAGASLGAELAKQQKVILLEAESQPGYHTTGRSAAVFCKIYGPAPIRALTRASENFFSAPNENNFPDTLLSPRGVVMLAREDQSKSLEALRYELNDSPDVKILEHTQLHEIAGLLRKDYGIRGILDPKTCDIDVNALHQGYLRSFKHRGGTIRTKYAVNRLERENNLWVVSSGETEIRASIIVNAAGAWADAVAQMAKATQIGLSPKRRTVLIVEVPDFEAIKSMPLIVDIDEQFYLKPESGRLLISPADETPTNPCDAQPDEMDIAICIERIQTAFDLNISRIENKWAGLRSFVSDKCPVIGFDEKAPDFFWMAGQGGYGIQSAPAAARLASNLIQGKPFPSDIIDHGLVPQALAPGIARLAA